MAEKIKPFEKIFPYVSYRWKYDDGEYSTYAPFSEVQFVSKPIEDNKDRYEKGFNVFMVNDTENIIISNVSKGREDVVAIDILYTESIASTVYILKTIELDPEDRGNGFLENIIISKRSFGIALPDSELSRQFDSVPRKAKAQEFTANRLIYGNYLHKFNQGKNDLGGDGLQIKVETVPVLDPKSGPSVKTNRTYDVGVVYMDKYGRQGGILSQKAGNNTENTSLIKTDFTYGSRIKLAATISLGLIGDDKATSHLINLLEDEEPNIRWDAAIGLAKMGNKSGLYIIESLLDREYLNGFPEVDELEKTKAIMVAIQVSSILQDKKLKTKLVFLAQSDKNLKIRDAAIKTLESTYKISI